MLAPNTGVRDAASVATALADWLAARSDLGALEFGRGDAAPTPTAIQLLVAAMRSKQHGQPPLGPRAEAALARLGTMAPVVAEIGSAATGTRAT
ncbi:MAG: hypothetical protein AAF899_18235 [Pseudomonadota bacterium]